MAPRIIVSIEEYDQRIVNAVDATLSRYGYQWWGTGFEEGQPARVIFLSAVHEVFWFLNDEVLAVL